MRDSRKNFSSRKYVKPFPTKSAILRAKLRESRKSFMEASSKDKAKTLAKIGTGLAGAAIVYKSSKIYRTKGYHGLRNAYIEAARRAIDAPFKISNGIRKTIDEIMEVGQKNFAKGVARRIRSAGKSLLSRTRIRAEKYVDKNINRLEKAIIRAGKFADKAQKKLFRRKWTPADEEFWANAGTARYARQASRQRMGADKPDSGFTDKDAAAQGLTIVKEVVGGAGNSNTITPVIRVQRYVKYGLESRLRRITQKDHSGIPLTKREERFMKEINKALEGSSDSPRQAKKAAEIRKILEKITDSMV